MTNSKNVVFRFRKEENTVYKAHAAYTPEMSRYIPSDNWSGESGIAFSLYRLCGGQLNNDKLLRLGLPGLIMH